MRDVSSTTVKSTKGERPITISVDGRFPLYPKADPNWFGAIAVNTSRLNGEIVVSVTPDYERKVRIRNHAEGGWPDRYYSVPFNSEKRDIVDALFDRKTLELIAEIEEGRPQNDPHDPLSSEAFEADMLLQRRLLSIRSA